jgi:hypothetical protein
MIGELDPILREMEVQESFTGKIAPRVGFEPTISEGEQV